MKKVDSNSAVGKGGKSALLSACVFWFGTRSGHGNRVLSAACARWAMRMSRTFEAAVKVAHLRHLPEHVRRNCGTEDPIRIVSAAPQYIIKQ